jgi:hypothetical protein
MSAPQLFLILAAIFVSPNLTPRARKAMSCISIGGAIACFVLVGAGVLVPSTESQ